MGKRCHELMSAAWDHYCKTVPRAPSLSEVARHLKLEPKQVRTWLNGKEGIPFFRIGQLGAYFMMSDPAVDRARKARIREMREDPNLDLAMKWLSDRVRQSTRAKMPVRTQDEEAVVLALQAAAVDFPRGLYLDAAEPFVLQSLLVKALQRAEKLHIEEASAEEVAPARARADKDNLRHAIGRVKKVLANGAAKQAAQRRIKPPHVTARERAVAMVPPPRRRVAP